MKNSLKLLAITALAAVIGFAFIACDDGNGTTGTAPTVTTATLPNGTVGTAYSQTLTATGDTPITWSIDTGSLPDGLTLSTAGVIAGTPETANTFNFTVKATNATGSGTKALSIVIAPSGSESGDVDLTGTITISPNTDVEINTELTATYSGSETVTYQWKKDGGNVGTDSNKYTPTEAGSYTVTVSATGYNPKTSAVVDVTDPSLPTLAGDITISPNTGVETGTELTATYTGSESGITYRWEKDGGNVGTNSNKYTPTEAGSYTVTVSAAGYNPKTSAAVTVTQKILTLSGYVTISPNNGMGGETQVNINTELTAAYTGNEPGITYQWKKDGGNVGTNSNKYTPTVEGSYTVTVSATGYNSITSAAVVITDPSLLTLDVTVYISSSPSNAKIGDTLTADYSGTDSSVVDNGSPTYQWERDGTQVGNGKTYIAAAAGQHTVTLILTGYRHVTSDPKTVHPPITDFTFTPNPALHFDTDDFGILENPVGGYSSFLSPYSYSLVSGVGDTDNDLFQISSNTHLTKKTSATFTETRTYSVRIRVTDGLSQIFEKVITFAVNYPPCYQTASASLSVQGFTIYGTAPNTDGDGGVAVKDQYSSPLGAFSLSTNYLQFKEDTLSMGSDVSSWFSPNLGLTFKINNAVSTGSFGVPGGLSYDTIQIAVSGTPNAASDATVTIKIPHSILYDTNGYPTITEDVAVAEQYAGAGLIGYDVDQCPENVARIGSTNYTSLAAAITAAPTGATTITILRNIELSSTVSITYGKTITLAAATNGLTISPATGFTDQNLFDGSGLILGAGGSHTPTLIIDGKQQVSYLISLSSGNLVLNSGAELRNSSGRGVMLSSGTFTMNGGAIGGCYYGITLYGGAFTMNGGIIYGTSAGAADRNQGNSIQFGQSVSATVTGSVAGINGLSASSTATFGTAP